MPGCVRNLYRLANLVEAEGRLREIDQRLADALQSYIDSLRLGNAMSQGGFIIHRLVGCACEADVASCALRYVVAAKSRTLAQRKLRGV